MLIDKPEIRIRPTDVRPYIHHVRGERDGKLMDVEVTCVAWTADGTKIRIFLDDHTSFSVAPDIDLAVVEHLPKHIDPDNLPKWLLESWAEVNHNLQNKPQPNFKCPACDGVGKQTKLQLERWNYDDPENDATDFAHPAWWRGNDHGVETVCQILLAVLDGSKKPGGRYASERLQKVVDQIYALKGISNE